MAERGGKKGRPAGVDEELARAFGAATMVFNSAVAERLGVGATDQKCLELVSSQGGATPGLLAERTGLTSGAITAVLDRLEKAGFVRREKDPEDRRQVMVRLTAERAPEISALFEPLRRGWRELCAKRGEKELAVVSAFLQQATELLQREAGDLRGAPQAEATRDAHTLSAPRGAVKKGRLEMLRGASRVAIGAGRGELLYRVRSEGPAPKVSVRDGRVAIDAVRSLARLFTRRVIHVDLCPEIPWELVLRGGLSNVVADLKDNEVAGLEAAGGVNDVIIKLPAPRGTVAVRVDGGAHKLRIERPLRVPARVLVGSSANGLVIDTLKLGSVGGETRWESPEYAAGRDRYDITIRGGSHDVAIVAV